MIPLATTTITVSRTVPNPTADGYDPPPAPTTIVAGVRAHISAPSGQNSYTVGNRTVYTWRLDADLCDLRSDDTVADSLGQTYRVLWARQRHGLGLDHVVAGLEQVEGIG